MQRSPDNSKTGLGEHFVNFSNFHFLPTMLFAEY